MSMIESLTLQIANLIADKALEKGRELKLAPLTVAVLDAGGHLKVLKREDSSSLLRPRIATAKAWGVLGMGYGGRELAKRAATGQAFFNVLSELSGGKVVPVPGGVIVRSSSGSILGSVGISGDASEKDEACAVYGIEAAGLQADTGEKKPS